MTEHGDQHTSDVRYDTSSRVPRVKEFASSVRRHRSIESVHWILDVVFAEDASRIRNGDATENFGFLLKFVISLLKRDASPGSLKEKRKTSRMEHRFPRKAAVHSGHLMRWPRHAARL